MASKYVMKIVIDSIHRGPQTHTQVSHKDMMNTAVLSDGCVVLQWRGSLSCGKPAPNSREEEGCELAWE